MHLKITKAAWKFIRKKQTDTVVLKLVEVDTSCCIGAALDIEFSFAPPQKPGKFRWKQVAGIDFYIDRRLIPTGTIVIKKHGLGWFSSLYADGLKVPIINLDQE